MPKAIDPAERLAKLTELCVALPETRRELKGLSNEHAAFMVGKKTFVWFVANHHGDGIVGIWCKVPPGENNALAAANPKRFFIPPYVGKQGWVGFRLDTPSVSWSEVKELIQTSYRMMAGKKLLEQM